MHSIEETHPVQIVHHKDDPDADQQTYIELTLQSFLCGSEFLWAHYLSWSQSIGLQLFLSWVLHVGILYRGLRNALCLALHGVVMSPEMTGIYRIWRMGILRNLLKRFSYWNTARLNILLLADLPNPMGLGIYPHQQYVSTGSWSELTRVETTVAISRIGTSAGLGAESERQKTEGLGDSDVEHECPYTTGAAHSKCNWPR